MDRLCPADTVDCHVQEIPVLEACDSRQYGSGRKGPTDANRLRTAASDQQVPLDGLQLVTEGNTAPVVPHVTGQLIKGKGK